MIAYFKNEFTQDLSFFEVFHLLYICYKYKLCSNLNGNTIEHYHKYLFIIQCMLVYVLDTKEFMNSRKNRSPVLAIFLSLIHSSTSCNMTSAPTSWLKFLLPGSMSSFSDKFKRQSVLLLFGLSATSHNSGSFFLLEKTFLWILGYKATWLSYYFSLVLLQFLACYLLLCQSLNARISQHSSIGSFPFLFLSSPPLPALLTLLKFPKETAIPMALQSPILYLPYSPLRIWFFLNLYLYLNLHTWKPSHTSDYPLDSLILLSHRCIYFRKVKKKIIFSHKLDALNVLFCFLHWTILFNPQHTSRIWMMWLLILSLALRTFS